MFRFIAGFAFATVLFVYAGYVPSEDVYGVLLQLIAGLENIVEEFLN